MGLRQEFVEAVAVQVRDAELTPAVLARAAAAVLPVDAASVTTTVDGLRLPLGATSAAAQVAEELQTTLGEGPCLEAVRTQRPVVADLRQMRHRWPAYAEAFEVRTPFRAVVAVPLGRPGLVLGALDLYAADVGLATRLDPDRVTREVGTSMSILLGGVVAGGIGTDDGGDDLTPPWYRQAVGRRQQVWVATGMLLASDARGVSSAQDALDLLRAEAYVRDTSLDDLAADLVAGRLRVGELVDQAPEPVEDEDRGA